MLSLFKDESGTTAIEYALIAALISIVIIAALQIMGAFPKATFNTVADNLGPPPQH